MQLFSNYLLILVLMVTWPVSLLLFLVFSAWLDRFAAQPPKWVVRRQVAAQARAEALNAANAPAATGRTRYWHPPQARGSQPGQAMAGRGDPRPAPAAAAAMPLQGAPPPATRGGPPPVTQGAPPVTRGGPPPAMQGAPPPVTRGTRGGPPAPGPARPAAPATRNGPERPRRQGAVDESTEPMAGYPVDRIPPEPPDARRPERRRPPAGWTGADDGMPSRVPAAWRNGPRP
jgi:hypothetical protein